VIRPDGTVESSIPLFTPGYLTPDVPLITATTPGTVLGGPLEWVLAIAAPVALAAVMLMGGRRRRRTRSAPAGPAAHSAPATSTEDPAP
jgi:apolipoprotein N-acyltransferase